MKLSDPIWFAVVVLLSAAGLPLRAANAAFELGGCWHSIHRPPISSIAQTNRRDFSVTTDGTNLLIRVNPGNMDQGMRYQEFGVVESTGYEFVRFAFARSPTNRAYNDATLTISQNALPGGIAATLPVWAVFAAHREWQGRTTDYLRPIYPVWIPDPSLSNETRSMIFESLLLRSEWKLSDTPPYFIKMFVNYRDGQLSGRRLNSRLLPGELTTGATNSRLDVLSWTNVSGLAFPLVTRTIIYIGDTNSPSGDLVVHGIQYFELTNAVVGTKRRRFVPEITPATRILDFRAATDPHQPAEYYSTNAVILEDPEEAFSEMQRQRDESRRRREKREREREGVKTPPDPA